MIMILYAVFYNVHVIVMVAYPVNITFVQRRTNVFDVGPLLYKCYPNVLRLLGGLAHGEIS